MLNLVGLSACIEMVPVSDSVNVGSESFVKC